MCIGTVFEAVAGKGWWSAFWQRPAKVLRRLLHQGTTPSRLAFSVALGATVGLAPLVWGTSLLCAVLAWRLKLNHLAVQFGNYACYPLQIVLFVPFLLAGQKVFIFEAPSTLTVWQSALDSGPLAFLRTFWLANLYALAVWLLVTPLFLGGCYLPLKMLLKRWVESPPPCKSDPDRNQRHR